MSIFLKNQAFCLNSVLLLALSNLFIVNPADAFSVTFENAGFEGSGTGGFDGWNTTGDTSIQSTFQSISPTAGSYQALITNACPETAGTLCQTSTTGEARNDDSFGSAGTFNYSSNDQISADAGTPDLQNFFGLGDNGLSIARENGSISGFRTAKEGSGIKQDITIAITQADVDSGMNAFKLSFNFAFLTNDGTNTLFGDQDFAFLSLYDTAGSPNNIIVLADSDQTLSDPTNSNFVYDDTTYHTANNQFSYSVSGLAAGTYTYSLGFGVVDVDNIDRSSALMLDNFQISQDVPFKFSPGLGLLIAGGMIGCDLFRRRLKKDTGCNRTLFTCFSHKKRDRYS